MAGAAAAVAAALVVVEMAGTVVEEVVPEATAEMAGLVVETVAMEVVMAVVMAVATEVKVVGMVKVAEMAVEGHRVAAAWREAQMVAKKYQTRRQALRSRRGSCGRQPRESTPGYQRRTHRPWSC